MSPQTYALGVGVLFGLISIALVAADERPARLWPFLKRCVRAGRLLAGHDGIPRWLRLLFVLGFLPIPGPLDEMVALLAVAIMWIGYRAQLQSAWQESHAG